jgi:hypothetical protein
MAPHWNSKSLSESAYSVKSTSDSDRSRPAIPEQSDAAVNNQRNNSTNPVEPTVRKAAKRLVR